MLKSFLNKAYSRSRGLEDGLDARLRNQDLFAFLLERVVWALRGTLLHRGLVFRAGGVKVKGRHHLALGRRVALGRNVTISAVGVHGIVLADGCTIDADASLRVSGVYRNLGEGINIGRNSAIGARNVVLGQGGVSIGENVLIGPGVYIVSENHLTTRRDIPIREQGEARAPIVIHDDVWIGANCVVLAGAVIGRGAVVAAGAVVRGEIEAYSVVAGVPARKVSER